MAKVYLSPPYHYYNRCAVAGCDENLHNNLYLDELEVYLTACGIEFRRGARRTARSNEDGTAMMKQAVRESDAWGADVHYVSHTNAFNGTVRGYRPMIFPGSSGGKKLADLMIAERKKIYSQPIILTERSDLYELRVPNAVSYYEEHVFHDNAEDARWFHDNMRAVAESAARGLCAYFGLAFVDPYAKPVEPVASGVTVTLPVLSKGDLGDQVKALQALLIGYGYNLGSWGADGDFGAATDKAVQQYQKKMGLVVDGIVGKATWSALLGI
jgi:hypothetical protein